MLEWSLVPCNVQYSGRSLGGRLQVMGISVRRLRRVIGGHVRVPATTAVLIAVLFGPLAAQERLRIDVGGYELEALRGGNGDPTVVIVTGLGDSAGGWKQVIPHIAQFTSAIVYSRAGNGSSDAGPQPRSPLTLAEELHALIGAMDIKPPVILAGHSLGGLISRVYSILYPTDVAGLVLIDGTHEAQYVRWGAVDPTFEDFLAQSDTGFWAKKPPAVQDEWRAWRDVAAVGELPVGGQLPDIPMAVLTAMKPDTSTWVGNTPAGKAVWRELHDEWYVQTSDGLRIVSQRSEHAMHIFEPRLVVDAIEWVVRRVRTGFQR